MKKGILKKVLGTGLAAVFIFALTACSRSGPEGNSGNSKDTKKNETGGDAENSIPEDFGDYVFIPEFFPLEDIEWVNAACGTKEGIYILSPFSDDDTKTAGVQGFYLDAAGTLKKLPFRFENTGDSDTCVSIDALGVLGDGSLVYIKHETTVTDSGTGTGSARFFLANASVEDGEELSCVDITEQLQFKEENSYQFIQFLKVGLEDHIYVSEGNKIWAFDISGKQVFPVATDGGSWIQDMGVTKEGQCVYSGWDSTAGGRCLFLIDETSGMVTPCRDNVPETAGSGCMIPGIYRGVLVNTLSGLMEYDTQLQTSVPVLNWTDCGMSGASIAAFTVLEDGNILAISQKSSTEIGGQSEWQSVLLKKTPAGEVPVQEKEMLTLGIFEESSTLSRAVAAFNQSQERYQIKIVNYGESDDLDTAINRFTNELIAGTGPDIFDLSRLNLARLAERGILEELTPYLETDGEVKRENYFESVLNAYSVDGKLYTIPNSFTVWGMVGNSAYLKDYGNDYGWTLEDVMSLAEANPGKEMFGYGSKNYVLLNCLRYNFNRFIDWQNGECSLDSEEFIQLLEFANRFPKRYDGAQGDSITDKMLDGTLMAEEISLSSLQERQIWEAIFGREFIIKGFPTEEGTGLSVRGNNLLAINAKSRYKETAWKFVKSLLTEEYYENEKVEGFPTRIQAYDRMNEVYLTPEYVMDEDGNQTEQMKGSFEQGDFHVDFRTSTEEEAEWLTDVIKHCDRAVSDDKQLMNIITEEAAAFFEGQKTAQETAEIIQSRVKMYVNENR